MKTFAELVERIIEKHKSNIEKDNHHRHDTQQLAYTEIFIDTFTRYQPTLLDVNIHSVKDMVRLEELIRQLVDSCRDEFGYKHPPTCVRMKAKPNYELYKNEIENLLNSIQSGDTFTPNPDINSELDGILLYQSDNGLACTMPEAAMKLFIEALGGSAECFNKTESRLKNQLTKGEADTIYIKTTVFPKRLFTCFPSNRSKESFYDLLDLRRLNVKTETNTKSIQFYRKELLKPGGYLKLPIPARCYPKPVAELEAAPVEGYKARGEKRTANTDLFAPPAKRTNEQAAPAEGEACDNTVLFGSGC